LLESMEQWDERSYLGEILKASNGDFPTLKRANPHFYILTWYCNHTAILAAFYWSYLSNNQVSICFAFNINKVLNLKSEFMKMMGNKAMPLSILIGII